MKPPDSGASVLCGGRHDPNVIVTPEPARLTLASISSAAASVQNVYRWPLGKGLSAEVILSGGPVSAKHIERLRQYLDLAKDALEADSADEAPE